MRPHVLAVAALTLIALVQCANADQAARNAYFESFLRAIEDRDYSMMARFVDVGSGFFANGKLTVEIDEFVYGKNNGANGVSKFRPLIEILQGEPYETKIVEESDGDIVFFVIPKSLGDLSEHMEFYQNKWMINYFACEFSDVRGELKMMHNFCFAETGGPYHPEYG